MLFIRTIFTFLFISFIVKTALPQTGWYQLNSGTSLNLNPVYFMDSYHGIIGADSGKVLRTTNGGINWVLQSTITSEPILCVFMLNAANYILASNTKILRTTNYGLNWDSTSSFGGKKFSFINSTTGFSLSGYKTTNTGMNWIFRGFVTTTNVIHTVFFLNENTGFAGATWWSMSFNVYNTFISKTTNEGVNWFHVYDGLVGAPYPSLYDIFFPNNNYGYALEYSTYNSVCRLLRTSDDGENWTATQLPTKMNSVKFVDSNSGWMCGINGSILHTSDGGSNWGDQQSPVYYDLNQIFMYDQNTGWIAGLNGTILKTTNGGVTGLVQIGKNIPHFYSLNQNYPNPFNPATKIKFDLPLDSRIRGNDNVTLAIYDVLGREITVLVNERLSPGTYEVEWDGSNYPSGVYLYKLTTGSFTETRKMVLVK